MRFRMRGLKVAYIVFECACSDTYVLYLRATHTPRPPNAQAPPRVTSTRDDSELTRMLEDLEAKNKEVDADDEEEGDGEE